MSAAASKLADGEDLLVGIITKSKEASVHVQIRNYKNAVFLDQRQFFKGNQGDWLPSPKGFALPPRLIPELIALLRQAEIEAKKLGLLDE